VKYNNTEPKKESGALLKSMDEMLQRVKNVKMKGVMEHDFSLVMIEHLQGGIDMSEAYLKRAADEKLKDKAKKMIASQKEEQSILKKYLDGFKGTGKEADAHYKTLTKPVEKSVEDMKEMKLSGDMDKDFAELMIRHHESGIRLAKMPFARGDTNELKEEAKKMVDDREAEIKELKKCSANQRTAAK
jgi:uncharacterized protein (DUF305 family)